MRPNVVCIVLDTARADAFEPYGSPPGSSPAVADLARRGAALPYVYATSCWSLPSHASMLTGELPRALGLAQAPGDTLQSARPLIQAQRGRLLADVFTRAGYETAAVSANVWFSALSGFDVGFETWVQVESTRQARLETRRDRLSWIVEAIRARADDGASQIEAVVTEWLARRRHGPERRPFLWIANLCECHSPYMPARSRNPLSAAGRARAAEEARRYLNLPSIWRVCTSDEQVPSAALERMRQLYAGEVRVVDDWLARLLEALDGNALLDETLVIVTADHGENLGEGGLIAHSFSLDDRLIHVPFVAAGPGAPSEAGAVSLAEMPRLIAEAVGLDDHPWTGSGMPGLAAAQWDSPVDRSNPQHREAMAEWGLDERAVARLTTPLTAVTDGRLKLVRSDAGDALYDLDSDPLELSPRALDDVDEVATAPLRAALDHPSLWAKPDGAPAASGPAPGTEELAEIEERMRLLGYL
jgi:arylsulfatase A-like enzyme